MNCDISDARVNENSFVVAIVPVPDFPDSEKVSGIVRAQLAVVGAVFRNDGWSFTILDKDEKHCIGDELLRLKTPTDKWVWCNLFR